MIIAAFSLPSTDLHAHMCVCVCVEKGEEVP